MKTTNQTSRIVSLVVLFLLLPVVLFAQDYRTGVRIGWQYRMQKFENPGGYGRVKMLSDGRKVLVR